MAAPKRVLLAGLFHETHTFLDGRTGLDDFVILRGKQLLEAAGDASPLSGVVDAAREHNWELLPAVDYRAMPGPMVDAAVLEQFWKELQRIAAPALRQGLDGIYLILHGAMVAENCDDVEGEILQRLRSLEGAKTVPLGGVLDLHATVTQTMADLSNGFLAYQENPHTDAKATAQRAAQLLDRLMRNPEQTTTVWLHPPLMWPPTGTATGEEPMRSLELAARALERACPELLAVNVFGGFSFADTSDSGVSFTAITTGQVQRAFLHLKDLGDLALARKQQGNRLEQSLSSVMSHLQQLRAGPIVLVEPADNIGGGAPGDGTAILRALAHYQINRSAVIINDPAAVAALWHLKAGNRQVVEIGGKGSRLDPGPFPLEVEWVSKSDGRFELEDAQSHLASISGRQVDMGPCVVVRHRGVTILLTSRKTPPFDLGQWRSQGIEPTQLFAIGVKAAVAHRRAYDPIARKTFYVQTPGPCTSNLRRLPFAKVTRPIFPLDEF